MPTEHCTLILNTPHLGNQHLAAVLTNCKREFTDRIILWKTHVLRSLTAIKKYPVEGNHEDSVFGCSVVDLTLNGVAIMSFV